MPPHPGPNMSDPNMPPQMVSVLSISLRVDILNCICRRLIYVVINYLQGKRLIFESTPAHLFLSLRLRPPRKNLTKSLNCIRVPNLELYPRTPFQAA